MHSDLHSAASDDRQSVPKEPRAESHLLLHSFFETLTTIAWLKKETQGKIVWEDMSHGLPLAAEDFSESNALGSKLFSTRENG